MKEDSIYEVVSKISNRLHNIGCEHQDSKLGEELQGMVFELWSLLPKIPMREPQKQFKYEKAKFKRTWQAVKAFESGDELYQKCGYGYNKLENVVAVTSAFYNACVYHRSEVDAVEELAKEFEALVLGSDGLPSWYNRDLVLMRELAKHAIDKPGAK